MSLKILLVSPISQEKVLGADFYFKLPSLGLPTLAAHTPPDCMVKMVDERISPLDLEDDADLVGITVMTPLASRAYTIADEFRQRGKKVVMGGMHVSALPDEALAHCDAVVIGEGESIWPQIIKDFKNGMLQSKYRANELFDFSTALPPRWDIIDKHFYSPVDFIETTRGCPVNCNYCSVTQYFGGKYRVKPLKLVEQQISKVKPINKLFALKNLVFFVDDNIIANRKHCIELLTMLKNYNIQWLGQASLSVARDDEILKLMSETRCLGLLVGMESLSKETLEECGKRINNPTEYESAVAKLHRYGIGVKAAFMLGFDNDTVSTFVQLEEFILNSSFDSIYFSILTPYPGTRLFQQMEKEGRLIHKEWEKYDTTHVVFRPKNMTAQQLQQWYNRIYKRAFSVRSIAARLFRSKTRLQFFIPDNLAFKLCLSKIL
jgi:radical SAM superfamily enzyme YgiQ (UPF0313 family)